MKNTNEPVTLVPCSNHKQHSSYCSWCETATRLAEREALRAESALLRRERDEAHRLLAGAKQQLKFSHETAIGTRRVVLKDLIDRIAAATTNASQTEGE